MFDIVEDYLDGLLRVGDKSTIGKAGVEPKPSHPCPTLAVPGLLLHVHHALRPGGAHGVDLGAVEQVPVTPLVIG